MFKLIIIILNLLSFQSLLAQDKKALNTKCEGGNLQACDDLAEIEFPMGFTAMAKLLWMRACSGGELSGCYSLGMVEEHQGSKIKARSLYKKACNGGIPDACYQLGLMEKEKGNEAEETRFYNKACVGGHAESCMLAGMKANNQGNTGEAKRLYKKSCNLGERSGCAGFRELEPPPAKIEKEGQEKKLDYMTEVMNSLGQINLDGFKCARIDVGPDSPDDSIFGAVEKYTIVGVIVNSYSQMNSCYEQGLKKNPKLTGRMVIKWVIGERGKVIEARVMSSTLDTAFSRCCVENAKTWIFPKPKPHRKAEVTQHFDFVIGDCPSDKPDAYYQ